MNIVEKDIKSPHVLIIPSWYPQNLSDISGSFFREQAQALSNHGYKVGVIFPQFRSVRDWKGIFSKPYGIDEQIDGQIPTIRWHTLNYPKLHEKNISRWVRDGLKLFIKYTEKYGFPDIIHIHSMLNAGFLVEEIHNKYNIPYVITEHLSKFLKDEISFGTLKKLSPIVENAQVCIAVSEVFRLKLNFLFNTDTWNYIPNMVNNDFLEHAYEKNKGDNFLYGVLCNLNKNKRVDLIIHAFSKVLSKYPDAKLMIAGDGPEKDALNILVEELNISSRVEFLGKIARKEAIDFITKINCLLIGSDFETFSIVAVEALALGKPIISTKCGGPESIIVPKVGLLVEKNSIDELAAAMLNIYENIENYNTELIRKYCEENFSEATVVNRITKIYSETLMRIGS